MTSSGQKDDKPAVYLVTPSLLEKHKTCLIMMIFLTILTLNRRTSSTEGSLSSVSCVSETSGGFCTSEDVKCISVVFGQGTKLNVIDSPLSRPVLTLLSPSAEALKESKVTLVCLAEDVSVPLVHVTWSVNGRSVTDGVWSSPTEKQPDKRFKMSSSLSVESSVWTNDADFSCEVSVGSESAKKSISVSRCGTTA